MLAKNTKIYITEVYEAFTKSWTKCSDNMQKTFYKDYLI